MDTQNKSCQYHLALIQKELKAPKSQYNKFAGFYYRNCEDIMEAVKPLLEGAVLVLSDKIVSVGGRNYVKATAQLIASDGSTVANTAYAREAEEKKGMDVSQITGAASSYARKYALNGLFAIDDTKDADHDEPKESTNTSPSASSELPSRCVHCGAPDGKPHASDCPINNPIL